MKLLGFLEKNQGSRSARYLHVSDHSGPCPERGFCAEWDATSAFTEGDVMRSFHALLLTTALCLFAVPTRALDEVSFDVNFNQDLIGHPPTSNSTNTPPPRPKPTQVVTSASFADEVTVVANFGVLLKTKPIRMRVDEPGGGSDVEVKFFTGWTQGFNPLPAGEETATADISMQVVVDQLDGGPFEIQLIAWGPFGGISFAVTRVSFTAGGDVTVTDADNAGTVVGSYTDDELLDIALVWDAPTDVWELTINGELLHVGIQTGGTPGGTPPPFPGSPLGGLANLVLKLQGGSASSNFVYADDILMTSPVPPSPVVIDIKPGEEPNTVNTKSNGNIAVAILGSDTFEVANVDTSTLRFGPDSAAPRHPIGGHPEDVNLDGFIDLVSHYSVQETGLGFLDLQACVSGALLDSTPIVGCDFVRPLPGPPGP
jgi:hypothetical protein